jgi:hypothetical protein
MRGLRDFDVLCRPSDDSVRRLRGAGSPVFGSISGTTAPVSRPWNGSITAATSGSITANRRGNQPITPAHALANSPAVSPLRFVARSGLANCGAAVSSELRGAETPPDGPRGARARWGIPRLPARVDLGDAAQITDATPLTRLAESARPTGGREPGRLVRRIGGLGLQAAAAVVLACAVPVFAAPAFGQSGPEPAPKRRTGPIPEPFPTTKTQPRHVSPPAPPAPPPAPPAAPPPASPPPPAAPQAPAEVGVVAPPPSPPVFQSPRSLPRTAPPRKQRTKAAKQNRVRVATPKRAAKQALAKVAPKASSPDGMLLAGGLALFVLVLAGTGLLTLSTRVLRISG